MRSTAYSELWGVVDGAVADAFNTHPDYLTAKGLRSARTSVTKRVTGTVLGFAAQAARGRLQPAEMPAGVPLPQQAGEGGLGSPRNPHCRIGKVVFRRSASSRILTEFNITTNRLIAEVKAKGSRHGN